MVLRFIYTLFIGILVALFIGLGISTFYEKPKEPEYPVSLKYPQPAMERETPASVSPQIQQEQEAYDKRWKAHSEKLEVYNRNVAIIALVAAIIVLAVSLVLVQNLLLISDGLLLGGVFTLLYALVRSFETRNSKFEFIVVTIGLAVSLFLGYWKFIRTTKVKQSKRR